MRLTPAMQQYMEVKSAYPDAIILFRMGDFYETFYEDAQTVAQVLNIALTKRGQGEARADLAGFPYHALEKYIGKLVRAGHKVAICEQVEDPKAAKGIVKRDVTRVITPGTVFEDFMLDDGSNNYIASVFQDGDTYGLAVCDISTGEFRIGEIADSEALLTELVRFDPSELVLPKGFGMRVLDDAVTQRGIYRVEVSTHTFFIAAASPAVKQQFGHVPPDRELAVCAAGALLTYLKENQKGDLAGIRRLQQFRQKDYMVLDPSTIRNLEIVKNIRDGGKEHTLLSVLDDTKTAMGSRLLKAWLVRPLLDTGMIKRRLAAVKSLVMDAMLLSEMREVLEGIKDIERLAAKISYGTANARDIRMICRVLGALPELTKLRTDDALLTGLLNLVDFTELHDRIDTTLVDDPPLTVREGGMIRSGYHRELDELHGLKRDTKQFMAELERKEIEATGISSLKIKYNRTFGYFLEVSNRYRDSVPEHYIRKQTLTTGERYITEELKEFEQKLLGAEDRIRDLEYELFWKLLAEMQQYVGAFQDTAAQIAQLDVLCALASVAKRQRFTMPHLHDGYGLELKETRHPVVEGLVDEFVSNDCILEEDRRFMVLTGPNMAGKSTYMRQVALCVLLAQMGSFVPAKSATLGVVDQIFTRVGAHDDLSHGQSTFMVEMDETAYILRNATGRSLIILDEIGRGTSTYDGAAIAWAVAEDIIANIGSKALFATHYHVLTELSEHEGAFNMNVAVEEKEDEITFLHRIIEGGTDKSYGVHVAKVAGLPARVIDAARRVQFRLESEDTMRERITVESIQDEPERVTYAKVKQRSLGDYDG